MIFNKYDNKKIIFEKKKTFYVQCPIEHQIN